MITYNDFVLEFLWNTASQWGELDMASMEHEECMETYDDLFDIYKEECEKEGIEVAYNGDLSVEGMDEEELAKLFFTVVEPRIDKRVEAEYC